MIQNPQITIKLYTIYKKKRNKHKKEQYNKEKERKKREFCNTSSSTKCNDIIQ